MLTKDKVKSKIEQLKKEDSKYLTSASSAREDIIVGLESKSTQTIVDSLKRLLAVSNISISFLLGIQLISCCVPALKNKNKS